MTAPQEVSSWSWIAPDGKESSGAEKDLADKLKKGELPPGTLVWRTTWLEWLPASRVVELATAFPPRRGEPPLTPKRSPSALRPPARAPAPDAGRAATGSPALPPSPVQGAAQPPTSFGTIGRARGPSVLGPPRARSVESSSPPRGPLPTIGDEPVVNRSTLRPPGAVPPPPRGVPVPNFEATLPRARDDEELPTRRQSPTSGSAPDNTVPDPQAPTARYAPASALPSELRAAVILPGAPSGVAIRPAERASLAGKLDQDLDATLGSTPFEITAQDFIDLAPPSTTLESAAPSPSSSPNGEASLTVRGGRNAPSGRRALVLGAGGFALVAGTLGIVKLASRRGDDQPVVTAPSASVIAPPAATPPAGCRIVQPAARLASSVHRPVTPVSAAVADGRRAAVGFAEDETTAVGLTVDLGSLDTERVFEEQGKQPVRSVVPLATAGAGRFAVDRDVGKHRAGRTLDTNPSVTIGTRGDDWVRTTGDVEGVLWPGAAADKTTDPHVASSPSGHVVTFRRGGLSGQVLLGFLASDGTPTGDLAPLVAPGVKLAGTPDVALSGDTWLVAFAGRAAPEDEWRVQLATGKLGEAPTFRTFPTPPGGAGGGSIAPSASGLGDGQFVLQWTEGKSGQYQVRVQRLSQKLEATGEPELVSPKGANAGQGGVFAAGHRVLSLFIQTTAGHDELWGTSLECP